LKQSIQINSLSLQNNSIKMESHQEENGWSSFSSNIAKVQAHSEKELNR
jgi:hypothetical protein